MLNGELFVCRCFRFDYSDSSSSSLFFFSTLSFTSLSLLVLLFTHSLSPFLPSSSLVLCSFFTCTHLPSLLYSNIHTTKPCLAWLGPPCRITISIRFPFLLTLFVVTSWYVLSKWERRACFAVICDKDKFLTFFFFTYFHCVLSIRYLSFFLVSSSTRIAHITSYSPTGCDGLHPSPIKRLFSFSITRLPPLTSSSSRYVNYRIQTVSLPKDIYALAVNSPYS